MLYLRLIGYSLLVLSAQSHAAEWTRTIADGATARAELKDDRVQVSDLPELTLKVNVPEGYQVDLKPLEENLKQYGEFAPSGFTVVDVKNSTTGNETTAVFTLSPQTTGKHYLTFHTIPLVPMDKTRPVLEIPSGVIEVNVQTEEHVESLPVAPIISPDHTLPIDLDEENQLKQQQRTAEEVRQQQNVLLRHTFPWHYVVLYPLILLALIGLARAVQRLVAHLSPPVPPISPAEEANEKLNRLRTDPGMVFRDFYIDLTQVLREYIERQYHVQMTEMTTEEFIQQMAKEAQFDLETRHKLYDLLDLADQVKFAQEAPNEKQCMQALALAKSFLRQSAP